MAEKELKSRLVQKHDIQANWEKAVSFIPKQGEIIVYDKDESFDYVRVKIGDGQTPVNDLAFAVAPADWNAAEGEPGHVLNKTHGTEILRTEGVFDGDYSKFEYVDTIGDGSAFIVKVSDGDFTVEDLIGATLIQVTSGEEENIILTEENVVDMSTDGFPAISVCQDMVTIFHEAYSANGMSIDAGIYFACSGDQSTYAKSLSSLPYFEHKTVKTIDPKYLPEQLRFGEKTTTTILSYVATESNMMDGSWGGTEVCDIKIGETYTVNYLGTEYICVAQDMTAMIDGTPCAALGDISGMTGDETESTGEPFVILFILDESIATQMGLGWGLMIREEPAESTFEIPIEVKQDTIVYFDSKYIDKASIKLSEFKNDLFGPINYSVSINQNDVALNSELNIYMASGTTSLNMPRDAAAIKYSSTFYNISEEGPITWTDADAAVRYTTSEGKYIYELGELFQIQDNCDPATLTAGAGYAIILGETMEMLMSNGVYFNLKVYWEIVNKIPGEYVELDINIPTKTSELTNDSGFITASDIPEVDVPTKTSQLQNDSGYITSADIPEVDLTGYAKTTDIPTKTSDLTNDSGFITAADIPEAPEAPVKSVNGKTGEVVLTPSDIGAQPAGNYLTEVPAGYATETYVNNKVSEIDVPAKTSELTNDSGFITAADIPSSLPEPSTDGAFLRVVNGAWAAVTLTDVSEVGA